MSPAVTVMATTAPSWGEQSSVDAVSTSVPVLGCGRPQWFGLVPDGGRAAAVRHISRDQLARMLRGWRLMARWRVQRVAPGRFRLMGADGQVLGEFRGEE